MFIVLAPGQSVAVEDSEVLGSNPMRGLNFAITICNINSLEQRPTFVTLINCKCKVGGFSATYGV